MRDLFSAESRMRTFLEAFIAVLLCMVLAAAYIFLSARGHVLTPAEYLTAVTALAKDLIPNLMAVIVIFLALHWYSQRINRYSGQMREAPLQMQPHVSATLSHPATLNGSINIGGFIASLASDDVTGFYIIAITGRVTVPSFLTSIDHSAFANKSIDCRVLLRSPLSADKKRADDFTATQTELRRFQGRHQNFKYETRTYSSATPFHCVVAEHQAGKFSAYMASYDWTSLNWRESTSTYARIVRNKARNDDDLLAVYLSWLDHYWGRHKVHTILFDFDDTLFLTTAAQAKAWIEAITASIDNNLVGFDDLASDVRATLRAKRDPLPLMTEIFLNEQDEENIFKRIFARGVGEKLVSLLERSELRNVSD